MRESDERDYDADWMAQLSGYIVTAALLAPCFLCVCCHRYLSIPGKEAKPLEDGEAAVFTIQRAGERGLSDQD